MDNNENKEKLIDVKGTIESFIQEPVPEMSQEDEIKNYKSDDTIDYKRKKKKQEDDDENEDDEHLKRLKQELLASLERVNKLAKELFNSKEYAKSFKVKQEKVNYKSKEKVVEDVKQKKQEGIERSRED